MMILGYNVFNATTCLWLADDEHSWTKNFHEAASFTNGELAKDIGDRESGENDAIYVMACM